MAVQTKPKKKRANVILMTEDEEAIKVINKHIGGTGISDAVRYALRMTARVIKADEAS